MPPSALCERGLTIAKNTLAAKRRAPREPRALRSVTYAKRPSGRSATMLLPSAGCSCDAVPAGVLDDFPEGDLEEANQDAEAGLTIRWGITPNMALLGTINPDFSQVEADAAQLAINERFALFFEEKRPSEASTPRCSTKASS